MTRGTANVAFHRPARIEEQHPSERLPSRQSWNFRRVRGLRQGVEESLGLLEKRSIVVGIERLEQRDEDSGTQQEHNRHSSTLHTSPFVHGSCESVILAPSCPCLRNSRGHRMTAAGPIQPCP